MYDDVVILVGSHATISQEIVKVDTSTAALDTTKATALSWLRPSVINTNVSRLSLSLCDNDNQAH